MSHSRFRSALAGRDAHIRSLRVALMSVSALALFALWGWNKAGGELTVHNPPDLSAGASRVWSEVPKPNVYDFAVSIFTQVNRWVADGSEDYQENLHLYSYYFTPQCRQILSQDYDQKRLKGELSGRERSLSQIPGYGFEAWRVEQHSRDSWTVQADLQLSEYVGGVEVKSSAIRWPLKVVRYDVDRNNNPWGLAIDCFDGPARNIEFKESK
ncbi:TIGR03746 family integrating conjugative element protein [Vibrio sinensis]|uniref:TIGR03746 family integrating conjugative element protein n=1 Tax=Vibrio sinensis TaxID=2302434 RepID=A0A3A6QF12_9VIBR|nr:TIGR03746 family integrating conjugative element protein [Vibrio sinensis]RJX68672.1 TIGR03746 family integrating conjugative element protein [Vibrio sinensis]